MNSQLPKKLINCIYYARGYCMNGDECKFNHHLTPIELKNKVNKWNLNKEIINEHYKREQRKRDEQDRIYKAKHDLEKKFISETKDFPDKYYTLVVKYVYKYITHDGYCSDPGSINTEEEEERIDQIPVPANIFVKNTIRKANGHYKIKNPLTNEVDKYMGDGHDREDPDCVSTWYLNKMIDGYYPSYIGSGFCGGQCGNRYIIIDHYIVARESVDDMKKRIEARDSLYNNKLLKIEYLKSYKEYPHRIKEEIKETSIPVPWFIDLKYHKKINLLEYIGLYNDDSRSFTYTNYKLIKQEIVDV